MIENNNDKMQNKQASCEDLTCDVSEKTAEPETPSDMESDFSEQYKNLPVWKQVVILILFLGGMTAVIMLINFIVEFGAEFIRALLK